MKLRLIVLCLLAPFSVNALACFTVYDRANRVVYHAQTAPVDMRYPLHQTLPRAFPGGHLVMDDSVDCPVYQALRPGAGSAMQRLADNPALELPGASVNGADTARAAGLAPPVYEPPVTPTLAKGSGDSALAVLSPPVPDALPMDTRGMVMTQLSDPPVTLYGRINHPPVR